MGNNKNNMETSYEKYTDYKEYFYKNLKINRLKYGKNATRVTKNAYPNPGELLKSVYQENKLLKLSDNSDDRKDNAEVKYDASGFEKNKIKCFYFLAMLAKKSVFGSEGSNNGFKVDGFDYDASSSALIYPKEVEEFYALLINNYKSDSRWTGDTMNSFHQLFIQFCKIKGIKVGENKKDIINVIDVILDEGEWKTADSSTSENQGLYAKLQKFAYLTHTLGNFMPVYGDFNKKKQNHYTDCFDFALNAIKTWYYNCHDYKKLPKGHDYFYTYREWLWDSFEGEVGQAKWISFIYNNLLCMYVDSEFNVIPFSLNHEKFVKYSEYKNKNMSNVFNGMEEKDIEKYKSCEGQDFKKFTELNLDDLNNYLLNILYCIEKRNELICKLYPQFIHDDSKSNNGETE